VRHLWHVGHCLIAVYRKKFSGEDLATFSPSSLQNFSPCSGSRTLPTTCCQVSVSFLFQLVSAVTNNTRWYAWPHAPTETPKDGVKEISPMNFISLTGISSLDDELSLEYRLRILSRSFPCHPGITISEKIPVPFEYLCDAIMVHSIRGSEYAIIEPVSSYEARKDSATVALRYLQRSRPVPYTATSPGSYVLVTVRFMHSISIAQALAVGHCLQAEPLAGCGAGQRIWRKRSRSWRRAQIASID